MLKKGIDPDSPEAQLFGRKLLRALTDVFGRCILETGFFHAGKKIDPSRVRVEYMHRVSFFIFNPPALKQ